MTRFFHTLHWELRTMARGTLIAVVAIAGAFLLVGALSWIDGLEVVNVWDGFALAFPVAGVIITAGAFRELSDPGSRIGLLLRPAAVWETVLAKIIATTVILWAAFVVAFGTASLLAAGAYRVLGGEAGIAFFYARGEAFPIAVRALVGYLPAHAVFFFGSVYFARHSFARTLLAAGGWMLSYALFTVVTVRLLFAPYIDGRRDGPSGPPSGLQVESLLRDLFPLLFEHPDAVRWTGGVLLVAGLWLLSMLRLSETEA